MLHSNDPKAQPWRCLTRAFGSPTYSDGQVLDRSTADTNQPHFLTGGVADGVAALVLLLARKSLDRCIHLPTSNTTLEVLGALGHLLRQLLLP